MCIRDRVIIINKLFPDAVLCMETALFYYEYSDRNPTEWNLAIDKNASRQRVKIDYPFVKAYRTENVLLPIGETRGEIDSIEVRIYDRDRTICDVLRNMNRMDKEIFNKAIQGLSLIHICRNSNRMFKRAGCRYRIWLSGRNHSEHL